MATIVLGLAGLALVTTGVVAAGAVVVTTTVGVVGVGAVAVAGGAVVYGGVVGGKKLYEHRKRVREDKLQKLNSWLRNFQAEHPELRECEIFTEIHPDPMILLDSVPGYRIGLGWDSVVPYNADLIAVVFDRQGNQICRISGLEGEDRYREPAIIHSGDCRVGGKEAREVGMYDENESIIFDFKDFPEEVGTVVLGVFYDKHEDLQCVITDSFLNGIPIYEMLSQNDFEKKKGIILEKKAEEDSLAEKEISEAKNEQSEGDRNHAFTYTIEGLGKANGFIPGKFSRMNGAWAYVPIQVPVAVEDLDDLCLQMEDNAATSVRIPNAASFTYQFIPENVDADEYVLEKYSWDRWNNESFVANPAALEASYCDYVVFKWTKDPRPFSYSLTGPKDAKVSCQCDTLANTILLCSNSQAKPHQRQYHLPPSPDSYLTFHNKPIEGDVRSFLKERFSIGNPVKTLHVEIVRGFGLPAKDSNGYSDPYVKIKAPQGYKKNKKFITPTQNKTLNPVWNYGINVDVRNLAELQFDCWDKDFVSADDYIGSCTINDYVVIPCNRPFLLENGKKEGAKKIAGALLIKITPTVEEPQLHFTKP